MPTISFSNGLASGLDTQGIIDALLSVGRQPAVFLEARVAQRTNQIAAFKGMSALFVALKIETDRLSKPSSFDAMSVTSSDEEIVTGTAGAKAAPASYTFNVDAVAQAHILVSQGFASLDASVGTGSVTIQVGSTVAESITIDSGGSSLTGLRDAINASDAEVTASIVNTGSGATPYRLMLTANKTGAANEIVVTSGLSGGTAPGFATTISTPAKGAGFAGTATFTNVGPAVLGTYGGTAVPTAGGSYTSAANRTFSFEAQNGGTVGSGAITFSYTNGAGALGTFQLPANYVAGTAVAVADGISVQFGAGTIAAGDDFTIAATGRGAYTGTSAKTFTFNVTTGGTVGTDAIAIAWDDGAGASGTINLPANYVARSQVAVADGVVIALDGGTLAAGDTFSVSTSSPLVQAAQDATIRFGGGDGGGSPITVTSDTNDFDNVIDGLTLSVKKASDDPVTVVVARDSVGLEQSIQNVVERYNTAVSFVKAQLTYDPEADTAGVLFSDPTMLRIDATLRRMATSPVAGLEGGFRALSSIGIRSDASGRLSINAGELSEALETDIDAVRKLFASVGEGTDSDVRVLALGTNTKATTTHATSAIAADGYAVVISRAAERGRVSGSTIADPSLAPLSITASNNVVKVRVNDVLSSQVNLTQGTYTSGGDVAAEIQAQLNANGALGDNRVAVSWVSDGVGLGHFVVESERYGEAASISIESAAGDAFTGALGFTPAQQGVSDAGVDVAGTINGEEAHGKGQTLIGGPDDPENPEEFDTLGVQLLVTLSAAQLTAQGSSQGFINVSEGVGSLLAREMGRLTDSTTGTLKSRENVINRQVDALNEQIDRIDERLAVRKRSLEEQFSRLESVILELQSQGQFLTSQLRGL